MSGRKFTELNAGTVGANSIFAQAQAPATPGDPYTSTKVSATDVGNFVNGTQAYADIGNVTPLAAIAALQQGGASTANANIADEYDSSHTYNTGNRVIYEGVLYVCNDDNVTGAWDSTKWNSATIDEIISALTAADIPYSAGVSVADKLDNVPTFDTLTTSDNNKLLGVSVSGDDISVGAVESITPISETVTYTNSSNLRMNITLKKLFNIVELSTAGPDGAMALPTAWTLVAELTNTQLFPTVNTGFAVTVDSATIFFNVYTDGKIYCFARGGSSIYVGGSHTRFY